MSTNPKGIIKAILTNDKLSESEKSELISELINGIKEEYPELKYHATKSDVKELELKLTKEIENTRKEIKEVKFSMLKWQFIFWITQMGAILAIIYKFIK